MRKNNIVDIINVDNILYKREIIRKPIEDPNVILENYRS